MCSRVLNGPDDLPQNMHLFKQLLLLLHPTDHRPSSMVIHTRNAIKPCGTYGPVLPYRCFCWFGGARNTETVARWGCDLRLYCAS